MKLHRLILNGPVKIFQTVAFRRVTFPMGAYGASTLKMTTLLGQTGQYFTSWPSALGISFHWRSRPHLIFPCRSLIESMNGFSCVFRRFHGEFVMTSICLLVLFVIALPIPLWWSSSGWHHQCNATCTSIPTKNWKISICSLVPVHPIPSQPRLWGNLPDLTGLWRPLNRKLLLEALARTAGGSTMGSNMLDLWFDLLNNTFTFKNAWFNFH